MLNCRDRCVPELFDLSTSSEHKGNMGILKDPLVALVEGSIILKDIECDTDAFGVSNLSTLSLRSVFPKYGW